MFLLLSLSLSSSSFLTFPSPLVSRKYVSAHSAAARYTIRFIIIPLFFAGTHKLPFSVDFPCFMRPTSAINVTDPASPSLASPPVPSSHSMTIYPGYVTFVAKNTFRPGRLLMNGHTRETPFLVPLPRSFFFCFRSSWQSTAAGAYGLVITILVSWVTAHDVTLPAPCSFPQAVKR